MRSITFAGLKQEARAAARQRRYGKIYLHWTGGRYEPNAIDAADYNLLVLGDGRLALGDIEFQYPTAATYMRNTGSFAVALCACYNAVCDPDSGLAVKSGYLPAKAQIEAMAKAVAVLCEAFDLSPARWEVMTHAEAADNLDGWDRGKNYGPLSTGEKWDLWKLADYDGEVKNGGDVLRGKANWYRENGAW